MCIYRDWTQLSSLHHFSATRNPCLAPHGSHVLALASKTCAKSDHNGVHWGTWGNASGICMSPLNAVMLDLGPLVLQRPWKWPTFQPLIGPIHAAECLYLARLNRLKVLPNDKLNEVYSQKSTCYKWQMCHQTQKKLQTTFNAILWIHNVDFKKLWIHKILNHALVFPQNVWEAFWKFCGSTILETEKLWIHKSSHQNFVDPQNCNRLRNHSAHAFGLEKKAMR